MERIRRGDKLPYIERLKQKTLISELTSTAGHSHTLFTLGRDRTGSGFHMIGGLARVSDAVVIAYDRSGTMLTVDVKNRTMSVNEGSSGVKHNQIVDLTVEGERWEAAVLNGKPCGWGVLFDKDNNKVYEGFRVGEMNVCYGRCFYADIESVEYAGEWCEGRRWRKGTQYDRNGGVVYEGEWVNDVHVKTEVVITPGLETFHNHIEVLRVSSGCCNGEEWSVLNMGLMGCLKSVVVENECFVNVSELKLSGMKRLESVVIGESCFTKHKHGSGRDMDRKFCLKNCPKLKSLKTGDSSFSDYGVIELENVDGLEVIEMGEMAFYSASLRLKSASWASG